jgi:hypothetical protein
LDHRRLAALPFEGLNKIVSFRFETNFVCGPFGEQRHGYNRASEHLVASVERSAGRAVLTPHGLQIARCLQLNVRKPDCSYAAAHRMGDKRNTFRNKTKLICDKVPTAYFLADVFLHIDRKFDEKVLHMSAATTSKTARALEEGEKLRSLISYLRMLFRGSEASTDQDRDRALVAVLASIIRPIVHGEGHRPEGLTVPRPLPRETKLREGHEDDRLCIGFKFYPMRRPSPRRRTSHWIKLKSRQT